MPATDFPIPACRAERRLDTEPVPIPEYMLLRAYPIRSRSAAYGFFAPAAAVANVRNSLASDADCR
ncbi:hypothetical protein DID98_30650 [Burkholderia sp. Bp8984]|nr:hypothetical protein DID98_30650 [Burkholderia sp. Bp8984]